jgi:hypothetical protein
MNYIEIKADKTSIKIGEHLTLRIKSPVNGELILPFKAGEMDKSSGLSIITSPQYKGDEIVFDVTSYKAGEIQIPSFQIKVKDEVLFETISLNIKVEGQTSQTQLADIKPPMTISPSLTYYLSLAGITIAVVLVIYMVYKKYFKEKTGQKKTLGPMKEIISPFDKAMRDLNHIQTNQNIYKSIKDILFNVTEVLKRFIQEEHKTEVMDLTSTELITALHSSGKFNTPLVNDLNDYLKNSDFIKFANQSKEEAVSLYIEKAKNFVSLLRVVNKDL